MTKELPEVYQERLECAICRAATEVELIMDVVEEFGGESFEMNVNERFLVTIERIE